MADSQQQAQARRLAVQPEANTETVESLVRSVLGGKMRVPSFQRGLKWKAKDVRDLYDSIYAGYPVGALLLQKAPAEAAKVELGPLQIQAPETQAALWVVDGQQRLVSLAAALGRPVPIPKIPEDPYVLYFDPGSRTFKSPPTSGDIPGTWVPVAELIDATRLSEWVFNWRYAQDAPLRKIVFDAGTRLRQYNIPLYTVETDDATVLKEIFLRINKKGKDLEWKEVHDAMFGNAGKKPSTLADLSAHLESMGMGTVPEELLLQCVVASRGLDVTQNVSAHYDRDPALLRNAAPQALPALRATLAFLKADAEIPHVRLLPLSLPVPVLARFFSVYPDPNPRVRTLLARWTWRVMLEETKLKRLTLLRRGVAAVGEQGAEATVQALLSFTRQGYRSVFEWPERFDARSAASRLVLLGMNSLGPLDIKTQRRLDAAAVIESNEGAVRRIWGASPEMDEEERRVLSSPANRILLPGKGLARREVLALFDELVRSFQAKSGSFNDHVQVLRSHGMAHRQAMDCLIEEDKVGFVEAREEEVEDATRTFIERMTGWEQTDRPSIEHLLSETG